MEQSISQSLCDGIARRYWKKLNAMANRPLRIERGAPDRLEKRYRYFVKQQSLVADPVFSLQLNKYHKITSFASATPDGRIEIVSVARDKHAAGISNLRDFAITKHALARTMYRTKILDPKRVCQTLFVTWHHASLVLIKEHIDTGTGNINWEYERAEDGTYPLPVNFNDIRGMIIVGTTDPLHKNLAITFVDEDKLRKDQLEYLANMNMVGYADA